MSSGLKYGLNIQKKGPPGPARPAQVKKKTIFDDGTDSEPEGASEKVHSNPPKGKGSASNNNGPPVLNSKYAASTHSMPDLATRLVQDKRTTEAAELDPTVYDYDAAYDALHAKTTTKKAAEQQDALERRPKYMENLLAAAEVRKRDALRAKDRLLQKERDEEGDEFADKEKFVTEAYKEQQEEVRKAEELERIREEEETRKRRGKGMTGFYKSVMDDEERAHQELLRAANDVKDGIAAPSISAPLEEQSAEKSAAQQAREMNAHGAQVIINDEGQVADKRQLLSAGLNIAPKPKAATSLVAHLQRDTSGVQGVRGRSDVQKATRERQTRMMEAQLEQAAKRAAEDDAEERAKVERAAKSRKTETDVSSAKERYLQRKKEAAAAAAAAKE